MAGRASLLPAILAKIVPLLCWAKSCKKIYNIHIYRHSRGGRVGADIESCLSSLPQGTSGVLRFELRTAEEEAQILLLCYVALTMTTFDFWQNATHN